MCALTVCICLTGDKPRSNYCYLQRKRLTLQFHSLSSPHLLLSHPPFFSSFSLITLILVSFYPYPTSLSTLHPAVSLVMSPPWYQTLLSRHLTSLIPSSPLGCHSDFLSCHGFYTENEMRRRKSKEFLIICVFWNLKCLHAQPQTVINVKLESLQRRAHTRNP